MSEYEADTFLKKIGMIVLGAVLLMLVAMMGALLMLQGAWTRQSVVVAFLAAFALVCLGFMAHGRQADALARPMTTSPSVPQSTRSEPVVRTEATFTFRGETVPLGEALDRLV